MATCNSLAFGNFSTNYPAIGFCAASALLQGELSFDPTQVFQPEGFLSNTNLMDEGAAPVDSTI